MNELDCNLSFELNTFVHSMLSDWRNVEMNVLPSVSVLKDMLDVRDGRMKCINLTPDDVQFIIDDICLN